MLSRIFPKTADNGAYRGSVLAVWLLVPIALIRLLQGANSVWHPAMVAAGADGIPLDSYGHAAGEMIVLLFALLGLYLILMGLIAVVVLIRYRALIPFAYLLFLASLIGTRAINALYTTGRAEGTPIGFYINMGLLAAMVAGFVLSLLSRRDG
jgi:hypothetical protein